MPIISTLLKSPNVDKTTRLAWQWNNILLEKKRAVVFKTPEISQTFQVKAYSWPKKSIPSRNIGITFNIKGLMSVIWLSSWPMMEYLKKYAPQGNIQKIPTELQIELIETVFEPMINFFEQQLDEEIKIQKLIFNKASRSNAYSVKFQLLENKKIITAVLVSHPKLARRFLGRLAKLPRTPNTAWLNHKTHVHYEMTSVFLSIVEIKQLTLSDVVFIENTSYFQSQTLLIRLSSGTRFEVKQVSSNTLEFQSGEKIMPESSNNQMKEPSVININDMPVRLSFDLGEESLTFKEVTNLQPGYILNLKKPFTNIIKIRSQNQLIGKGEIVDIEGRVGIRITQLFSQKN